jgi:hypothetical protein
LSTKAEQLEWRRSKVTELRARGLSYTEIASELQVSRTSIAILASNGAATVPSYYSGSLNFAASQAAFHTLGGLPFTVTYTIDATAKSPSG